MSISDPLGISLPGGHPSVDRKSSARDPGCLIGGQIQNHIRHLFWFPGSPDRIMRQNGIQLFRIVHERSGHRRIDESRIHHIAANALFGIIDGNRPRQGIKCPLGSRIGRQRRNPDQARDGGDIDDSSLPWLLNICGKTARVMRNTPVRFTSSTCAQVASSISWMRLPEVPYSCIVHKNIERAELLARLRRTISGMGLVCDRSGHRHAGPCRASQCPERLDLTPLAVCQ